LAAVACSHLFGRELVAVWRDWFFADITGLAVGLPALLLSLRSQEARIIRAGMLEIVGLLAMVAAATLVVFAQSDLPIAFVVFISMMIIAFRLGPRGVAWAGVIVAVLSMTGALASNGPIAIVGRELSFRIHVAQFYAIVSLYAALAVSLAVAGQRRLQLSLERRNRLTREARQRAVEASRAKTQFLATMSHEIRTPMNSILGFTRLLVDAPDLPESARRRLSMIDSAGASLMTVVDDILDFSKVEAGQIELATAPVTVRRIVDEAVAMIGPPAQAKGLTLNAVLNGEVDQPLMADPMRVRQVLLNLLNNAVKFTAEGGIELAAEVIPGDHLFTVRFSITDTGVGIPLDRRDRLFVRFSQVDATVARQYGGTGLGLAISKGLVELMDGVIGVKSAPGHGSTFWFELPLQPAEAAPEPVGHPQDADASQGLGARILLVDDHPMNRELGGALLTIMGCDFDTAEDGQQAVDRARAGAYDAILMDVHMPGMDGLTATRLIRALPGAAGRTPIIAMTADVLPEHVAQCRAAGMVAHVAKPVRPEALFEALYDALATAEDEPPAAIAV
jgi:signal transduction histidine kinase/ActR/RegA family two-component response regulator